MTEEVLRGQELTRRRIELGIDSVKDFSDRTGVSREAVSRAERGIGSPGTYERLEAWLIAHEESDGPEVEFEVTGPASRWHFSVRGPADIADELRAQVVKLIHDLDAGD